MNNIFYIGTDDLRREQEDALLSKCRNVFKFKSIDHVKYKPDCIPDLILIDRRQSSESSFKEFMKTYNDIPKIVYSKTGSFRGFGPWKKSALMYPVYSLSPGELKFYIEKAVVETKRFHELEQMKTGLARIKQELNFYEEVSKTLTSTLDLNEILAIIMKNAKKLIKAETWSVLLLDEDSEELYFARTTAKKQNKEVIKNMRLRLGEGIAGWVAQEGVPVVVPDVSVDPRFCARIDRETDYKTKTLICVPIKSKNTILGVLEIINKTTNEPFTRDDLELMLKLVDHAAIAVERASIYQKMADLSVTDDLTKLFNTRYLNRTLEVETSRANRYKTSLSLIFMDVDYFKSVNDNYGHLIGSKVLVEMGQLLIRCLRSVDIVARYGGDEFVIVLPQTPPKAALQIAERIRKTIEDSTFLKKEGYSFKLTASFGVASFPESAQSKEDLLRLADEAMYQVKYQTRNGVYAIV